MSLALAMAVEVQKSLQSVYATKLLRTLTFEARLYAALAKIISIAKNDVVKTLIMDRKLPSSPDVIAKVLVALLGVENQFAEKIVEQVLKITIESRMDVIKQALGLGIVFDFKEPSPRMLDKIEKATYTFAQSTFQRLVGNVEDNLAQSFRDGVGIDEAARRLEAEFDNMLDWELRRIARTEINRGQSMGAYETIKEFSDYVQWWTGEDERVRDDYRASHVDMHGQIVKVGNRFSNGLLYPLEPGAQPEEVINCRCRPVPWIMKHGYMAPPERRFFYEADIIPIGGKPEEKPEGIPEQGFLGTVTNIKPLNTGITKTFRGEINGKRYLFKSNENQGAVGVHGNAEAEIVASKLMQTVGLDAATARYGTVIVEGVEQKMIVMDWVDDVMLPIDYFFTSNEGPQIRNWDDLTEDHFNWEQFRIMQAMDILIGNRDRHQKNYFIGSGGDIIPIDHNLTLISQEQYTDQDFWGIFSEELSPEDTVISIIQRSTLGEHVFKTSTASDYKTVVDYIKKSLTDEKIKEIVNDVSSDLDTLDKELMIRILTYRRDNIGEMLRQAGTAFYDHQNWDEVFGGEE